MRIPGPNASGTVSRLVNGLDEDDFAIPGHVVADVTLEGEPERQADGSIVIVIEALTVEE